MKFLNLKSTTDCNIFKLMFSAMFVLAMTLCIKTQVMAAVVYEQETNETYATATEISAGDSVVGNISSASDIDIYKIIASDNGKIELNFSHTYENSYDDWDVETYIYENGQYTKLSSYNIDLNSNEKVSMSYIGVKKGSIYYVEVSRCCSGIIGKSYTLQTSFTPSEYVEKELNNIYNMATPITLNNSYNGVINKSDDKDYYKITAPANGKISINFLHAYENSYDDWDVETYIYEDGQYTRLSSYNIDLNSNEKIAISYIGAKKDITYYIVVSRCCNGVIGRNYTLQASFTASEYFEKELNNVYSTATPITLDKTYSGIINNSSDLDYYKYVASSNDALNISFKHTYMDSYDDWNVYVYFYSNGQYSEISRTNIDLNSRTSVSLPAVGARNGGIYYIKVARCCNGVVGQNYNILIKKQPHSHSYGNWTQTKAATVFATGSKRRTCSTCGYVKKSTIPKLKPTVKLSATKKTLRKKQNYILKMSNLAKGDSIKSVTSNKKKIASVKKVKTNRYKISAKKKGNAVITVKLKSGKIAKCNIAVK